MQAEIILYAIIFIYGIVIGSFVNVLIYRIPRHENFIWEHSHCMSCGHRLRWYDLIPLFSWLQVKGQCRYCRDKISPQYPCIEAINGIGYLLIVYFCGFNLSSVLYVLTFSLLVAITVIDWRTFEIPFGLNLGIFILGLVHLALDYHNTMYYLLGMVAVSGFLLILYLVTRGRGIGGGDIKLMAAAGLLLGWKHIVAAFFLGCIIGSVIHLARMKVQKKDHVLAFGPYLSAGIFIIILFGDRLIHWYMSLLG